MMMLIVILSAIYIASLGFNVHFFIERNICPTFWPLCAAIIPGFNTLFCIWLFCTKRIAIPTEFFDFKDFLKNIK